jgi:hypothetical protein
MDSPEVAQGRWILRRTVEVKHINAKFKNNHRQGEHVITTCGTAMPMSEML